MYGGHITDAWDRRTCNSYLSELMNEDLFAGLELGPGFSSPDSSLLDYNGYLSYVDEKLPQDSPTMFGLHPNAEIGYLTNWTASVFEMILSLGGGDGGKGGATPVSYDAISNKTCHSYQIDHLISTILSLPFFPAVLCTAPKVHLPALSRNNWISSPRRSLATSTC